MLGSALAECSYLIKGTEEEDYGQFTDRTAVVK